VREYPKTENLFTRDPVTHKLNVGDLRRPEFGLIKNWFVTEKVDGTNIRVLLSHKNSCDEGCTCPGGDACGGFGGTGGVRIEVRGRSDRANVPQDLIANILSKFTERDALLYLDALGVTDDTTVCIYGEGYGPGIQKGGGSYTDRKSFRMFDVTTTREGQTWWRSFDEVERASEFLNLPTVPVLRLNGSRQWDLASVVEVVAAGVYSRVQAEEHLLDNDLIAEGVIARTDPYLYDFRGGRVMFKLKGHDLP
jgi:hypothetical protein